MATALTIGVDAVEGGGRDDGHFALAQRTLDGQMLPAARVHLNKMAAALATALGFGLWAPSSPWPCTTDIASLAGAGRCRRSCRRRRTWPTRAGCPPATGGASTPGRGGGRTVKGRVTREDGAGVTWRAASDSPRPRPPRCPSRWTPALSTCSCWWLGRRSACEP